MKTQLSEKMFIGTPETKVKVSPELHQKIMRAVRLAEPRGKKILHGWTLPAWGLSMTLLAFVIFQMTQPAPATPVQPPALAKTQNTMKVMSLMALGDSLAAISGDTLLSEKELIEEFERLKSDLERFGFKS